LLLIVKEFEPDGSKYPGRKGGNMDNGIHVPLVMKYPGVIPAATGKSYRKYDGLVNVTDVFPTIADAAKVDIPYRENLKGISFWPHAPGKKGAAREYIYTFYNGNNNSIHNLEDLLVYAFDKDFKRYAPSKEYPNERFFDLRKDPLETGGDTMFKRIFDVRLYSGLNLQKLNKEQKAAYLRLGKIIDDNAYTPVKSLIITNALLSCTVGEKVQLQCKVLPENATRKNVIWVCDNPDIATIDKFGALTATKKGRVTINLYSWDDAYPGSSNDPVTFSKDGTTATVMIDVL
jgi:arylsulfatase A